MRPELEIAAARRADAAAVEALLDAGAEWQRARGFARWTPGTFSDEIDMTIDGGYLFVGRLDGALVGCFMFDTQQPAWMERWLADHGHVPHGAHLARLAVSRDMAGRGVGAELLSGACAMAAQRGLAYLRLDCPAENAGAPSLLPPVRVRAPRRRAHPGSQRRTLGQQHHERPTGLR